MQKFTISTSRHGAAAAGAHCLQDPLAAQWDTHSCSISLGFAPDVQGWLQSNGLRHTDITLKPISHLRKQSQPSPYPSAGITDSVTT